LKWEPWREDKNDEQEEDEKGELSVDIREGYEFWRGVYMG